MTPAAAKNLGGIVDLGLFGIQHPTIGGLVEWVSQLDFEHF